MNKISSGWTVTFIIALAVMAVIVALNGPGGVDSANIVNGSIIEEDLACIDLPADGEALTYDAASGECEWVAGGGGGVHPVNVATDATGILDVANGGSGISDVPADNEFLIGDGGGDYATSLATACDIENWYRTQYSGVSNALTCDTGTISSAGITDNSIASIDILVDTIVATDVATGGITTVEILDGTITATDVTTGGITTVEILDATILAVDLSATDSPADGEVMTYDSGSGGVTWDTAGGGGVIATGRVLDGTTASLSMPLGWGSASLSSGVYLGGTMHYIPFYTPTQIGVDAFVMEVTAAAAAGKLTRGCLYEVDDDLRPGDLVLDLGQIAIDANAVLTKSFAEQTIAAGNYAFAIVSDANVTYRLFRTQSENLGAMKPTFGTQPYLQQLTVTGQTADVAGGCDDPATAIASVIYGPSGFYIPLLMRISTP